MKTFLELPGASALAAGLSFTPGGSKVLERTLQLGKPLKRFLNNVSVSTGLKSGVNEKDF